MRAVRTAVVMLLAAGSLAGCSPEIRGRTGFTVDATGRPVAVLAWCEDGRPTRVTLRPDALQPPWTFTLRTSDELSGSHAEVPLYAPPEGWTTGDPPLGRLVRGQVYSLRGGGPDGDYTFTDVEVRVASLARIRPGTVVTQVYDPKSEKRRDARQTPAEFRRQAATSCR